MRAIHAARRPLEDHVARHFEDEVAEEEHTGTPPEDQAVRPISLFMVSAAKPTLMRSR